MFASGHTFRVYPQGVNSKQISKRVLGLAIMLYLLGLSYGAVEIVLASLAIGIGKSSVYRAVQAAAEKVPGMKQRQLLDGYKTKAIGADVTSVRCGGKWLPLGVSVDAMTGMTLSIDSLPGEDAEQLKAWLKHFWMPWMRMCWGSGPRIWTSRSMTGAPRARTP